MNDSEKRRRELLEQTRELYSDRYDVPAIHPRYRDYYRQLYPEDSEGQYSTFGLRVFFCVLLFVAFVAIDAKKQEIWNVDSKRIVQEITTDLDIEEVWKEL